MPILAFIRSLNDTGLMRRLILIAVAAALIVAVIAGLLTALVESGHATPAPSTANAVRIDTPAVVRILTVWDAQVICHGCGRSGSDVTSPQQGAFETYSAGSGAFISPDGYILTADHVTEHSTNNPDDVQTVLGYAANDFTSRFGFSADAWLQFFQQMGSAIEVRIATVSSHVFLSTGYTGQLQNTAQVTSYQIQRVVASSPVYKQDTSIIKIEAHDMPYLTLATASSVNVGDTVTSIGFPGDADYVLNGGNFTSLLDLAHSDINTVNSLLSSSVQTGQVTATKSLTDGTPVYETSGISAQGSSGGPVINMAGQIIGFVDAGPTDHRLSFLIPSSVVADYAHEANVTSPAPGAFMSQWASAINDYDATGACHLSRAAGTLQQLRNQYPNFGAAQPLLENIANNASANACPSALGIGVAAGGVAGLLALAAAMALAYVSLRRQDVRLPVAVRAWYGGAGGAQRYGEPSGAGGPFAPPYQQPWGSPSAAPSLPTPPFGTSMPATPPYGTPVGPYATPVPPEPYPGNPGAVQPAQPAMPQQGVQTPMLPYPPDAATIPPQAPLMSPMQQPAYPAEAQAQAQSGPLPAGTRVCSQGHVVSDPTAATCPYCGAALWEMPTQP